MVVCYSRYMLFVTLVLVNMAIAQAAEFTAGVDRNELLLQEHVVLTLSLINSDTRLRAEGISPNVDLSVLTKEFDVGTPHVENRYNIYRGQGRSTSELSVDLFPRRSGRLSIPSFSIDGLSTTPITIVAHPLPPGEQPEIFSKAGVSATSVWQRQQVVAWLDVYHRIKLKTASVGEYIATEPMAIELLEHQDLPQSERKEDVNGVNYDVTRIAWSLFPKKSGTLTIHLPDVWAVTADGRKLRLPHQQQQVNVKALPADIGADITVGTPIMTQTTPSPAPNVNSISTWIVTVRGPFSRFALPDTLPLAASPSHIKMYSDHAQRDTETVTSGLTSVVHYTLSVLPQIGGKYELPPIRIPYFDTKRGVMALAELPGTGFSVADIRSTTTPSKPAPSTATAQQPETNGSGNTLMWRIATLLFAVLWITTTLILWKRPRTRVIEPVSPVPDIRETPPPAIHHPLQAKLLAAFGSRTLEQGLLAWEHLHGVDLSLRNTVRAVQQLCYGHATKEASDALIRAVEGAVANLGSQRSRNTTADNDPWRPESFATDPSHK